MHPILQPLPLNLRLQLLPQRPIPHNPRLHRHLLLPQQSARPDQMLKPLELNQPPNRNHPQRIPHLHPRPRKIIQLNPIVNPHHLPLTLGTHLTQQIPTVITHRHHKLRLPRHLRQQLLAPQVKHEILRVRRETEREPQLLQKQRAMRRPVRKMHMHMPHPELPQTHRHEPRIPRPRPRLVARPIALLMILHQRPQFLAKVSRIAKSRQHLRWRWVVNLRPQPIQPLMPKRIRRPIQRTHLNLKPQPLQRQHLRITKRLRHHRIP